MQIGKELTHITQEIVTNDDIAKNVAKQKRSFDAHSRQINKLMQILKQY